MYRLKAPDVFASEIAELLNSKLHGSDFVVHNPCSVQNIIDSSFFCLESDQTVPVDKLRSCKDVLILASRDIGNEAAGASFIICERPRVSFMKAVNEFYIEYDSRTIAESARIDSNARVERGVFVGENSVIGPGVTIGANTKILNNAVITGQVEIGRDCLIKDNATVGSEGFDFEYDEDGTLVHCPQIGKIVIGNGVWIGANSSIESSTTDVTVIEDNVKIDDLVQIGGKSIIREGTMVTAGTIVSRDVVVGRNCLLAPNVSVRDSIIIGDNVTVGMGAVVVKDLASDAVYVGNPAHLLESKRGGRD